MKINDVFDNNSNTYIDEIAQGTNMIAKINIKIDDYVTKIEGVNLVLKEREKNEVKISKSISGIKVILSDRSILIDHLESNPSKYVIDIGNKNQKLISIDDEIKHGATLEVTYAIVVKNIGKIDNVTYTLVDYVDEDYHFNKSNNLNKEWNTGMNNTVITNVTLNSGEEKNISITLTRLLDIHGTDEYDNIIEIKDYSSVAGRRIYYTIPENKEELESDIAIAEFLAIIPPLGG